MDNRSSSLIKDVPKRIEMVLARFPGADLKAPPVEMRDALIEAQAVAGLAAWTVFLLGELAASAWAACGVVLVVASLGLMMLFRWLPSPGRHAHGERTAERNFPVTAVVAHGVCAVVTVLLVLAVAIRST